MMRRPPGGIGIRQRGIALLFVVVSLATASLRAQTLVPYKEGVSMVVRVDFEGDLQFSKSVHQQYVRVRPNRNFLGIPGMPLWLWM
ncbi:MAG: hypothetical protein ACC655_10165, partial [Rhodothermia bacterium]